MWATDLEIERCSVLGSAATRFRVRGFRFWNFGSCIDAGVSFISQRLNPRPSQTRTSKNQSSGLSVPVAHSAQHPPVWVHGPSIYYSKHGAQLTAGVLNSKPKRLKFQTCCQGRWYSMLGRRHSSPGRRTNAAVPRTLKSLSHTLVAEWIHFILFGIILPTIKLKVYTFWGL